MTDQDQIGRKLRGGFEQAVYYIAVEDQTARAAARRSLRDTSSVSRCKAWAWVVGSDRNCD